MRYLQAEPVILRVLKEGDLARIDALIYNLGRFPNLAENLVHNLFTCAVKVATVETIEHLIKRVGKPTGGVMLPDVMESGNNDNARLIRWKKLWLYREGILRQSQVFDILDIAVTTILTIVLFLEVPYRNGNLDQFRLMTKAIVERGDLEKAFWMCRDYPECVADFMIDALNTPSVEFFYHFYHQFSDDFDDLVNDLLPQAFAGGSTELIVFLMERGAVADQLCLERAVKNGRMEALQFGCEIPSINPNFTELCYLACSVGDLDIVKYLHEKGAKISPLEAQRRMVIGNGFLMGGSSDVAEWLFSLETDRKRFLEQIIEFEKEAISHPSKFLWDKTVTETLLEGGFDYHHLSGKYKYIIAPYVVPKKIKKIRMRKFGWYWHSKWLIKSGNPNNPRGEFIKKWIATIPTDFVHE
jgi:hypothetical protein